MIDLDEWQKEVLNYEGDILLCTGRRVGKTYIMARKAIDLMAKRSNCPIIMISLTEDQAMVIMQMALNYAKEKYPSLIGKGKKKPTLRSLYVNNNRMVIRPVGNTGDGARGFEGGVLIIDEASRMPKKFWIAALPIVLTTGGQVWMASTPYGKQGYFWERFNESYNLKKEGARFKVFYKTTEQVVNERPISVTWTEKQKDGALRVLAEDKKTMSFLEYGQEYLGLFLEELRQFFPDELIERSCVLQRRVGKGKKYLGVDIARMGNDESTFEIVEKIGTDNFAHIESIITKKTLTTNTYDRIVELHKIHTFRKIGIDAGSGSLGVGILDFLLRSELRNKVVAMNNRARALDREGKKKVQLYKEDMYQNLKAMMELGIIKLLDDEQVRLSLRSIQYEYLDSQTGKASVRIFGSYSHVVEGLIRAAQLANEDKTLNIWVEYR